MCITKVESFDYAGKLYTKEIDAVKAALHEIATRIVKEYSAHPFDGLVALGADVSPLRARYLELLEAEKPAAEALQEAARGPKTTSAAAMNTAFEDADPRRQVTALRFVTEQGYPSVTDFMQRANRPQREEFVAILKGVRSKLDEAHGKGTNEYAEHVSPHSSDGLGG